MQPLRVFVSTGLSSSFIRLLPMLLVLAENVSTVRPAALAEESFKEAPLAFPENGVQTIKSVRATATPDEMEKLRILTKNSEVQDMQTSNMSEAVATMDSSNDDGSEISTQHTSSQVSTMTSSAPDNNSNTTEPIATPNSNSNITEKPNSLPSSTTPTFPATTEIATTMPTTRITDSVTILTTTPQMDTGENVTATAVTEDSGSMPTGVVALVTMITFAIIAVLAYISLIVWRRYLEYRYGNRELLVNDLEFDTNDLRHFEL